MAKATLCGNPPAPATAPISKVEITPDTLTRRGGLALFSRLARTVRKYRDGILRALELPLSNARLEGTNNKIRLLSHRAYGFHSAQALIAMIHLCCAGIQLPALQLF